MRWPAGSSGRRRPLPVSLGGDRRQDDGRRARPPSGERRGAPPGLTPGPMSRPLVKATLKRLTSETL